jgi:hypothetical protein
MQQSNRRESKSREDRKMGAEAEECGAGAGEDLEAVITLENKQIRRYA